MGTVDKLTELQYRRNVINNGGGDAAQTDKTPTITLENPS